METEGEHWYVRPSGGSYGLENGTSYANAWNGFDNITWGGSGVVAGDTLFVCGVHNADALTVGASGISSNVIKIYDCTIALGSSNEDPGTIWAGQKHETGDMTGPDGNGIFTFATGLSNSTQAVTESHVVLLDCDDEADPAQCIIGNEDSWYEEAGTTYYNPNGIAETVYGPNMPESVGIDINEQSFITIDGLRLYMGASSRAPLIIYINSQDAGGADDITVRNAEIRYGTMRGIDSGGNSDNTLIEDSTFIDNASAFYFISSDGQKVPDGLTIQRNLFEHTKGVLRDNIDDPSFKSDPGDRGQVALGGGTNILVTENYFKNIQGMCINPYLGLTGDLDGMTITFNYCDLEYDAAQYNDGIGMSSSNASDSADRSENMLFAYNVFKDCKVGASSNHGAGIRMKTGIPATAANKVKVYNNTFYNCEIGIYLVRDSVESEAGGDFRNNLMLEPVPGGTFIHIENVDTLAIDVDFNTYSGSGDWVWDGSSKATLAEWQAASGGDANASTSDPRLNPAEELRIQSPVFPVSPSQTN